MDARLRDQSQRHGGLPRQRDVAPGRDGRAELNELAHSLSAVVEQRRRRFGTRGDRPWTPLGAASSRRARAVTAYVVLLLVAAGIVVALATGHGRSPTAVPTAPAPAATAPDTPAGRLGEAAGHRLSRSGRPLDGFVCEAAYAAEAPQSQGALPVPGGSTQAHAEFIAGCMSDMSGR